MLYAKQVQKVRYDAGRRDPEFSTVEVVLLSTTNLPLRDPKPFRPRYIGPFKVARKVNAVAYTRTLPAEMDMHPTFHVSLLRKLQESTIMLPNAQFGHFTTESPTGIITSVLRHRLKPDTPASTWFTLMEKL
ncbi:hypothetical protein NDN08_000899 [Rhodosorus marinus]|uniref:Tf2-1-like SH3-like domain-containing protein n=1 Tax=Rhodosorus marinus TaxID=101924 RepID=A0AAV8UPB2_9RHOD|nr:hypothetical protein NDN08_000899 [Rhodosorus marinus]